MDTVRRIVILLLSVMMVQAVHYPIPPKELNKDWLQEAKATIDEALKKQPNTNVAKNVILFLGDGMGFTTVWAARVYTGQKIRGVSGEEHQFAFEKFDNVALSKTYNVDYQISDSAGTATAFLCGVKANGATIGVNEKVMRKNCTNQAQNSVNSILDWSLEEGKSVGIVSTARITHATPAAVYAHSAERYWESDTDFADPENQPDGDVTPNLNCGFKDIARQLVEDNPNINVILGGGRRNFLPNNMTDPEYSDQMGRRQDGRDLAKEWMNGKAETGAKHSYVWNKAQFDAVDPSNTDYLLGLFEPSHMQYELDRDHEAEPSISDLTRKAVQILQKNNNGFFLLVEGGRIDHAHHDGMAMRALHETYAMNEAVEVALDMTDSDDTLIVVTADHSHAFTTGGYPSRGNDILGLVDTDVEPSLDDLPYSTLTYANGPGAPFNSPRSNLTGVNTTHKDFLQPAIAPLGWETHGGEDVPIYAQGPMAHLFYGVHEQNYIAYVMGYAACVGADKRHCDTRPLPTNGGVTSICSLWNKYFYFMTILIYLKLDAY